jgi:hypothetical protein
MIDINFYDFSKKPFDEGEKFNIFPLSDEGVNQYYSKDSHTHTFLDKINPRKMEQIYKEKLDLDDYMKTVMQDREVKRQDFLSKMNFKKSDMNCNSNTDDNGTQTNQNYYSKNDEVKNNVKSEENQYNNNQVNPEPNFNNNENVNKLNQQNYNERRNFRNEASDQIRSHSTNQALNSNMNYINNNNKLHSNTRYGFSSNKFTYKPLDEKLSCFGKSTYGKLVQPKLSTSTSLSKPFQAQTKQRSRYSINDSQTQPYIPNYVMINKKKIGFESYNIPRVAAHSNRLKPIQVSQFDNRCYKSLSKFFDSNDSDIHTFLDNENKRLGSILLNQTSEGFLRSNRLPKISLIVNQPDIVVRRTKVGNSKFMGTQYNPFNFNPANSKNLTKRNINGSLFQH